MIRPLTDKQQRFCQEYVVDLNCEQAMLRANYAPTYARHRGYQVLANVGVRAEIDRIKAEIKAEAGYEVVNWLKDVRTARKKAFDAENWPAVAAFDRLLAQYTGALELDNRQRQTQLAVAVKNEQTFLDDAIKQARALQGAPDALVE